MIQRQNPMGGFVEWPLGWLLTYQGADCHLWRLVYSKCVESRLCRELAEMLMNELRKHKCFALLDIDDLNDIVPCCLKANQISQSPNQPKHSKQNHQSSSRLKLQLLNRLSYQNCSAAYALSPP